MRSIRVWLTVIGVSVGWAASPALDTTDLVWGALDADWWAGIPPQNQNVWWDPNAGDWYHDPYFVDNYVQNGGTVNVESAPAVCADLFVGGIYVQWEEVPVAAVGRQSTVAVYTALTVGGTLEVGGAGGELSCTGRPRVINYRKRRQRYGSPSLRCQFPICFRDGCTRSVVLALEEVADRSADGRTSVEAHREGG